jgi:hypothetical protein
MSLRRGKCGDRQNGREQTRRPRTCTQELALCIREHTAKSGLAIRYSATSAASTRFAAAMRNAVSMLGTACWECEKPQCDEPRRTDAISTSIRSSAVTRVPRTGANATLTSRTEIAEEIASNGSRYATRVRSASRNK